MLGYKRNMFDFGFLLKSRKVKHFKSVYVNISGSCFATDYLSTDDIQEQIKKKQRKVIQLVQSRCDFRLFLVNYIFDNNFNDFNIFR